MRTDEEVDHFRSLVQAFVRRFGLLVSNQTPCGRPISISHAHALMVLLETRRRRSAISQSELGEALGIDKSNVARVCSRMEEAGHATQRRAPDDGRSRLVVLTDEGAQLAREIERASRARFRGILEQIEPKMRPALFDCLATLNAALVRAPEET